MQPDQTIPASAAIDSQRIAVVSRPTAVVPTLAVLVVFGLVLFGIMTWLFPLVTPTEEQLRPFPPEEISIAREHSFALGRWLNPLIALTASAFVLSLILPLVTSSQQAAKPGMTKIVMWAIGAALLTAVGVTVAWLVTEFIKLPKDYTMLKTVAGHCIELSFFTAAIAMAVGAFQGGRPVAVDNASRGILIGFLAAIVFDLVAVMAPRAQVDTLFPGGVIWGNRDPYALAAWIGLLMFCVLLTLLGVGRKSKPVVAV